MSNFLNFHHRQPNPKSLELQEELIFLFLLLFSSRNFLILRIKIIQFLFKLFPLLISKSFHSFNNFLFKIVKINHNSSKLFSNFPQFALRNALKVLLFKCTQNSQKVFEESLIFANLLDKMHIIYTLLLYFFIFNHYLLYLLNFFQ